jgi:hypothetical protein
MAERTKTANPLGAKSWDKSSTKLIADKLQTVYANNAQFELSNWDMSIVFGELGGESEDGKLIVNQNVKVTMSLQHAKVFTQALQETLANFENQFGTIQLISPKLETAPEAKPEE